VIHHVQSGRVGCRVRSFLPVSYAITRPEIPVSHQLRVDNSMLVTPTLEWQDHLSSCYAVTDKPRTSDSSVNPDSRSSPQRRRLDKDTTSTPAEWGRLYKIEPTSGECGPQLPESTDCAYRSLSVLSRFQSPTTTLTLTIPHQWSENCHSTRTRRYVASQIFDSAQYQCQLQVRYHSQVSGLHLLSQADRTDERRAGGVWWVNYAVIPSRLTIITGTYLWHVYGPLQ
jgi:hypothetical protein